MSATDELRRLLDERGIEWKGFEGDPLGFVKAETAWGEVDGWGNYDYWVAEYSDGTTLLNIGNPTPEQAVEATLGSDLKAENEQLRRERDFYFQQVTENGERAHGTIDALNAENAKLRELVAALYRCADAGKPCETCPLFDGDGGCLDADRMQELGIEVE